MVTIGTLNGGNITITTGGSTPVTREETRFWWSNDESVYDEELIFLLDDAIF